MFLMKHFSSKTQKIGKIGENIACRFLMKRGFSIIDRNFTYKTGEIDIVASYRNTLRFIEVKSVSREISYNIKNKYDEYRPEDQFHTYKQRRMISTINIYLSRFNCNKGIFSRVVDNWQIDLILIYLDFGNKKARINMIENVI